MYEKPIFHVFDRNNDQSVCHTRLLATIQGENIMRCLRRSRPWWWWRCRWLRHRLTLS